jgi:molybdate transport system regulatory protein
LTNKLPRPKAERPAAPFPRLRIRLRNELVLGPGKIQLIQAIDRTGSISAAGRALGMSYRRAWLLVDALNRMFDQPVVRTAPGGAGGGGAQVTDFGRAIAAAYARAEERASAMIREEFAALDVDVDAPSKTRGDEAKRIWKDGGVK